jgi:hypothetical protein
LGAIATPPLSLFFVAVTHTKNVDKQAILRRLEEAFGKIMTVSESFDFTFTDYYEKEMGRELTKFLAAFKSLEQEDALAGHKLGAVEIEKEFLDEAGNRKVNIDPGFMSQARVILSSSKNFAQRIYLGRGVFAEVTLLYHSPDFTSLPWTYPDYQSPYVKNFLKRVRGEYTKILKGGG